ncbi:Outer membrane protein OmpA and related peptidoglycan-associated (lipo)proteins (OmpA) (PDB:1OAP) [Commensalibacter communis]|uniref:OmpA family protein n=1 Tax=Commensalibacter communis TaxID=2972786 RepID=UPI0022FFA739|nr:OmpA family protein [Commensalibacter communis]CAI3927923.1 Outer membrane protein OmpA and related peptidoglycan-associated (lipo)proteins (OmpA) (PDB:1OAP) [Commensalibacter communis]CAI3931245.1 Outer membrane protein OmpA and related peptidoglycan-associated (lipo)proteins (OmpA) (PDB:1OAP) [Commensalibacter communis]
MNFPLSPFSLLKKRNQLLLTSAFASLVLLSTPNAIAQVSVNHSALSNLGDGHKTKNKEAKKNNKHFDKKKYQKEKNTKKTTTPVETKPPASAKPAVSATIPPAPPPVPVFKDANIVVPLHPPAPPEMPKVIKEAKGEVRATTKHTLLIFDQNSVDLNESMMKAIMDYANMLKQRPESTVYLNAYSHGNADDLSTPRRMALNRGLAIRAVLINQGIPSTRIYLLAKGIPEAQDKDLSADHVEMIRSDLANKPEKPAQHRQ